MLVTKERSLYHTLCKESKETVKESFQAGVPPLLSSPTHEPLHHHPTYHLTWRNKYTDNVTGVE